MSGFSDYNGVINSRTALGQTNDWDGFKIGPTAKAAGVWTRLWASAGLPGAGAEPTSSAGGTAYTNTDGSVNWANQSPAEKFLATYGARSTVDVADLLLYDRLVFLGGVSIASTGDKTINTTTLPRYSGTDAVGLWPIIEVTTAVSAGTPVITLNSYTTDGGTTGRAGAALTLSATPTAHAVYVLPMQAGDKGIRSIETINVGTAGTSGVVNVGLIRPLVHLSLQANCWREVDLFTELGSMPRVYDGASLGLMYNATATTASNFDFRIIGAYV